VGAMIGGTVALGGGQAGPQVAIPEEVVTVPVGALIGGAIGGAIGYFAGSTVTETVYEFVFEEGA
jgi:hypothetical protein